MSDDDCDIFNIPTKRANAMPQKLLVPDQETKQTDYDFIEKNHEIKKPIKVNRAKQAAKEKSKTKSGKRQGPSQRVESNNNERELAVKSCTYSPEEALALPMRYSSPASQMIYLMEITKTKENAKDLNDMPIAKRTRSSMGGLNPAPEKVYEDEATPQQLLTPPKKQKTRARKKGQTTAETPNLDVLNVSAKRGSRRQNSEALNVTTTRGSRRPNSEVLNTTAPRGTRRQVAEIAARSRVLDSIDLVSAVMPAIEGFVDLDSDAESAKNIELEQSDTHTSAFDEDNPEIAVNLSWLGEIQMYNLRQHQKFSHMFKEISKRNNVPIDDIVINMDDRFIKQTESPQDVNLKIYHILNGCAIESNTNSVVRKENANLLLKPKKFQLKVQGDKWKKPLIIAMKKTETFKILYIKCAEEIDCDVQGFKLFFDGELLEPDDTPKNQEMEGNEMIDLRTK